MSNNELWEATVLQYEEDDAVEALSTEYTYNSERSERSLANDTQVQIKSHKTEHKDNSGKMGQLILTCTGYV